jgi:hypothetical protein
LNHIADKHYDAAIKEYKDVILPATELSKLGKWEKWSRRLEKRKGESKKMNEQEMNRATTTMIIGCGLPLVFAEKESFKAFMKKFDENYTGCDHRTVKRNIDSMFEEKKKEWQKIFEGIDSYALTTDAYCKNTRKGDDLMGVNIHWQQFDGNKIEKKVKMIEIKPYAHKSKNAENWQENLQAVLVRNGIYDEQTRKFYTRMVSFVTDGEAALIKCLRDGFRCCHLRCGCHQVSIVLKNGFSNDDDLDKDENASRVGPVNAMELERSVDSDQYLGCSSIKLLVGCAKEMMLYFHTHPSRMKCLREILDETQSKVFGFVGDHPIRWEGKFRLIERVLLLRPQVTSLLANSTDLNERVLLPTELDWLG